MTCTELEELWENPDWSCSKSIKRFMCMSSAELVQFKTSVYELRNNSKSICHSLTSQQLESTQSLVYGINPSRNIGR